MPHGWTYGWKFKIVTGIRGYNGYGRDCLPLSLPHKGPPKIITTSRPPTITPFSLTTGHQRPLHFPLKLDTKDHLIVHCNRPSRTNPFSYAKDHQLPLYFPLQLAINYRFIFWCNGPLHFPLQ